MGSATTNGYFYKPALGEGGAANLATYDAALDATDLVIKANADHVADNSQAHSDYLINNGNDTTSGTLTAAGFVGNLTGNVTGNCSGTSATVTGAAQTAITSLGVLTALQIDNINIDGNTISSTAGTDLNITPLTGQQIVLDGTIIIDAGVVTGATSISSTGFTGALTGNADTATNLAGTPALPDGTTATTQSMNDNSTKLATTAYADLAAAAGGASQALDNLASVAINTSLVSDSDNTDDLGATTTGRWKDLYLAGNITDDTNTVTVANLKTAYDHSQDNTQAHSDYLLNSGNDTMAGVLTCDGVTMGANENLTQNSQTLKHDGTDFIFSDSVKTTTLNITGGQITFPASQSSSGGANVLDDYEEGTWTIGMQPGTSGSITLNGSYVTGYYTKVGRLVTCTGYMTVTSVSSPVGQLQITGLPFTVVNNIGGGRCAATVAYNNLATTGVAYISMCYQNSTQIIIWKDYIGNNAAQEVEADDCFQITVTYMTA